MIGAGFSLSNVSGRIHGNVFRNNVCGRGGAGALIDSTNENTISIERNHIDASAGTEPKTSHGGGLYLLTKTIKVSGNLFTGNTVTAWGAGLYIGSDTAQHSTATLSWNVYRNNRAGISGGGLFCDDGATCISEHEIFDSNCGGNILLDGGNAGPTIARFNHMTNVGAREVGCQAPGNGVQIDKGNAAPDAYSFTNAIFWGNAPGRDFALSCDQGCRALKVNVTYSMVQTDHVAEWRESHVRRRYRGTRRSALCQPRSGRLSSQIIRRPLDALGLRQGQRHESSGDRQEHHRQADRARCLRQ